MSLKANLSLLISGSVDEQELTDLPGKGFTTSIPVWVASVNSLASSPYDRAPDHDVRTLQNWRCGIGLY